MKRLSEGHQPTEIRVRREEGPVSGGTAPGMGAGHERSSSGSAASRRRRRRRAWLITLPLLAMIVLAVALVLRAIPPRVAVIQARTTPASDLVYATGFVEPRHPVVVSARITAPVRAVLVDEGDAVRRGQPLILLDDREQRMMLAQATALRIQSSLAERRTLTLFGQGWVTRAAREQAVATADAARSSEAAARARLDQMVVRAGIDGIVLKRDVQPGDMATPSAAMLEIGSPHDVWVTATIDERDVPQVHVGQAALLKTDAFPGRVFHGRLAVLTPGGDPSQRAFRARIVLTDGAELPIGLTLEANIVVHQRNHALMVPRSALSDGAVWRLAGERVFRRSVTTGLADDDRVEILKGLQPGDWIARRPAPHWKDGARIQPVRG